MVKNVVTRRSALGALVVAVLVPHQLACAQAGADQYVTPRRFGAIGNGVADDTAAIKAALATQSPVDWEGLTYRTTSPIFHALKRPLVWRGGNAAIIFDPSAHAEYALRIHDPVGLAIQIDGLTIDGRKKANKPLEVLNNTSMATPSTLVANGLRVTGAKRFAAFEGGDGIFVRGAFDRVTFNGGKVWNCELPKGQGKRSVIGITGITVMHYSPKAFVRLCVINGVEVEKIYSSDPGYQADQDGVRFFGPRGARSSAEGATLVVAGGSLFRNCYGRSIKTQCDNTVVQSSTFIRDEGLASGAGNAEIDAQSGSLDVEGLKFRYSNNQQPFACLRAIGINGHGLASLTARRCNVFVASGTTLKTFACTYGLSSKMAPSSISDITIRGAVEMPVEMIVNGPANVMEVSNFDLDQIVAGRNGNRALVYVKRTGKITPVVATVKAYGNVYRGSGRVVLLQDRIAGVWTAATLSEWDNHGFA